MKKVLLVCSLLALVSCSKEDLNKEGTDEGKASVVALTRVYQRVIRYNCQDQVESDRVETVQSPVQTVSIQPKTRENIYSSSFKNLTVSSEQESANCITNYSDFTVDASYGWCNMHVIAGGNQIQYRFYYCDEKKTQYDQEGRPYEVCAVEPVLREEGTLWIKVTYDEYKKEETATYKPTPETCAGQKVRR